MADPQVVAVLRRQIAELDALLAEASRDLNAVRGAERVAKWKVQATVVLGQQLGADAAGRFAALKAGPSFTQDLLEELMDEAEVYRNHLEALIT